MPDPNTMPHHDWVAAAARAEMTYDPDDEYMPDEPEALAQDAWDNDHEPETGDHNE